MGLWSYSPGSFFFKFLSFAIRQPCHLVDDGRHFALIILNECDLRAIDFQEEICFRFRIKIQSEAIEASGTLPDQMISISPDGHPGSKAKDVIWDHFILASTGVEKFCVQLDRCVLCWRLCQRSYTCGFQALEWRATDEDGHGDVALQPGPAAGRNPADENSHDHGGRKK